jgi:acyl-CoA thioester hydrolase
MTLPETLTKEPESFAIVRFQDCDPFGHLNNARYIDYFLNARQDHLLAAYGINIYRRDQPMTASWVTKKNQIAYLRPALLAEEVLIRTRLIYYNENTIVVEGLMLDKEAKHLKSLLWVEFAYINMATGRLTNHGEEWMQLLAGVLIPDAGYETDGFNQRVELVRQQSRKRVVEAVA